MKADLDGWGLRVSCQVGEVRWAAPWGTRVRVNPLIAIGLR